VRCRQSIPPNSAGILGLRAGARYGSWCLICSWPAAALMIVFGVMDITALVVLTAVVYAERVWLPGRLLRRLGGVAALTCGLLVVLSPSLAVGLHQSLHM
jgi:predicted metal-binding membrane protein